MPSALRDEFQKFINKIEKKKKEALLKMLAKAQKLDPVGGGSVNDGIK